MTKLEALRKTELMWLWLADNPTKDKKDYEPVFLDQPAHLCYCCQYVVNLVGRDVFDAGCSEPESNDDETLLSHCPLNTLWPSGCQSPGSPYRYWSNTGIAFPERRAKYAKQIADAAHKEILELCNQPPT